MLSGWMLAQHALRALDLYLCACADWASNADWIHLMKRIFVSSLALLAFTTPGSAHWGHVGELAGHGHWIGVGALILAGGLAGIIWGAGDRPSEAGEEGHEPREPGEEPVTERSAAWHWSLIK